MVTRIPQITTSSQFCEECVVSKQHRNQFPQRKSWKAKKAFSDLDESFRSSVKFGDNSKISVMGKGKVTIQTKGNSTHTIGNVFFVPDLKTNLLSVGQLQEK